MEAEKRSESYKNSKRDGKRFCPVAAITFENIFLHEPLQSLSPEVTVKDFLAVDGISDKMLHHCTAAKITP